MKLKDSLFYAKILLFGEYSIIEDSMGLTVPYNFYQGRLKKATLSIEQDKESNRALLKYHQYLLGLQENNDLLCDLDLVSLKN